MQQTRRGRPPKSKSKAKVTAKAQKKISLETLDDKAPEELQNDPVRFVNEVLGSELWRDQERILEAVRDHPRVAWRSCHGIGKTHVIGRLVLWFLYSFPYSIVLTTAPTWRQVEKLVWKEVRSAYARSDNPLGGNLPPKATELSLVGDEWVAMGLSTNDPDRFQGYHAEHLLVVVDEAAGVKEDIFEAIEGVLTSSHCREVLIGNPTNIGGQFYRAFSIESSGWSTGHTAAWDTPNFTEFGITEKDLETGEWEKKIGDKTLPMPGLITPAWAADKLKRWGKAHPAYQGRVVGQFPQQGSQNLLPLAWVEAAFERFDEVQGRGDIVLGVDVARYGPDLSTIIHRQGRKVLEIQTFSGLDTHELAGEVYLAWNRTNAKRVNVDVIGQGAGVVDALKALHSVVPVMSFNSSSSSQVLDESGNRAYGNLRAECWWSLREAIDPKNPECLGIPYDDELLADLSAPLYSVAKGYTMMEPKDETKKRLGRSPDRGDALMMTFMPLPATYGSEWLPDDTPEVGAPGYSGLF